MQPKSIFDWATLRHLHLAGAIYVSGVLVNNGRETVGGELASLPTEKRERVSLGALGAVKLGIQDHWSGYNLWMTCTTFLSLTFEGLGLYDTSLVIIAFPPKTDELVAFVAA